MLCSIGVKHVEAYGDSLLVVQQVTSELQCLEGSLRAFLDACLNIIDSFAKFQIRHVPRHKNQRANMLAQQASSYDVGGRNFHIQEKPMHEDLEFFVQVQTSRLSRLLVDASQSASRLTCGQPDQSTREAFKSAQRNF
jgi:hypothetical protein